jgi:hypothetical protein
MSEVMHAHHCALEGPDAYGQVVSIPHVPRSLEAFQRWRI